MPINMALATALAMGMAAMATATASVITAWFLTKLYICATYNFLVKKNFRLVLSD